MARVELILFDLMPRDHLRLGHPARVDALKRVKDEMGVIARRPISAGDWVEHCEIRGRNKDQLAGPLRPPDPRRGKRRNARGGSLKQFSSAHGYLSPPCLGVSAPPTRRTDRAATSRGPGSDSCMARCVLRDAPPVQAWGRPF